MAPSLLLNPEHALGFMSPGAVAALPHLIPRFQFVALPPVAGAVRPPVLTFIIKAGRNVGQQLLRAYYCLDRQGHTGKSSSVLVNSDKICGCALSRIVKCHDGRCGSRIDIYATAFAS